MLRANAGKALRFRRTAKRELAAAVGPFWARWPRTRDGRPRSVALGLCESRGSRSVRADDTHRGIRAPVEQRRGCGTRWRLSHPDDDFDHAPPPVVPEIDHVVPGRHSASAEAAALRWT